MTVDWEDGPWVVGLDLSLTSTGIAYANGTVEHLETDKDRDVERLALILDRVRGALDVAEQPPDLAVIEGYGYHGTKVGFAMGELGGLVRYHLWTDRTPYVVVPPNRLKLYALGKGGGKNTDKTAMVVAARERLAYDGLQDDEADALWLRAYGLDLLGAPLIALPQAHRAALADAAIVRRAPAVEEVPW